VNLVAVVKRDCPTCSLIEPVLKQLDAATDVSLEVITQDDPAFPSGVAQVQFDDDLSYSYHHDIETVPTLLRVDDGVEQSRLVGWRRDEWETFTGVPELGPGLPEWRPGCGSLSVDPSRFYFFDPATGRTIETRRAAAVG